MIDTCGSCNICDYSGYDKCPQKADVAEFVADGPYADVINEAYMAWLANGKRRGRVSVSLTHWRR